MSDRRPPQVLLPMVRRGPLRAVLRRIGLAFAVLLLIVLVVYVGRGGYKDNSQGGSLSLLDSVYYATVTASTTGYGDIVPVSAAARLANIVIITPLRVIFLVILVGTSLEVLAERTRQNLREKHWGETVHDHVVVIGFGTKGRAAAAALLETGVGRDEIVVIDTDHRAINEAAEAGFAGVIGDATRSAVQRRAVVERARQVVVAAERDDTAVLITLTARQLNPGVGIQASVREAENAPLLRQSGADHVVTSSETAGRLLGISATEPAVSEVMEDLLAQGAGIDLTERPVRPEEVGRSAHQIVEPTLAVIRDGVTHPFDHPGCESLRAGDRLIVARSVPARVSGTGAQEPGKRPS